MTKKKPEKKPAPDWGEIERRYVVLNEKPADIAKDYDMPIDRLYQAVTRRGWVQKKQKNNQTLRDELAERMRRLSTLTFDVLIQFSEKMQTQMHHIENPYLFDGERVNSLYQTGMNNAVKLTLESIKASNDTGEAENSESGFIGVPSVDIDAL